MYMILVGGGNVGLHLARRLLAEKHEVLLMEKDPRQAQKLSTMLGDDVVYLGDGCEVAVQKASGFARADVVVAVTGEDEDNLVVCQMAKHLWHVKRVLARVNDPAHESVFRQIGIDQTVSSTEIIFNLIEQQISMDEMIPIGALDAGNIEVVEAHLSHRSPVLGKSVRDLILPPQTNIVYIIRNHQGVLVSGDTLLMEDDTVVALVPRDYAEQLREQFHPAKF